jgi:alanine racemase
MAPLESLLSQNPPQAAFTHFYSAELNDGSMELQEERFRLAVAAMPSRPAVLHAEHSAAIVRRPGSEWDLVRPGIFLYGVGSGPSAEIQPANVVSLRARIVELREVRDGDGVSYHGTYQADGPRIIATTALGYADGYRRAFSNSGWAAVNGKRASVAGLVTMDMTMLDVTGIPCKPGDVATFIGEGGGLAHPFLSVAESANLSPYELLTTLRSRLPRVFVE